MDKKVICLDVEGNKWEIDAKTLAFRPSVYGIAIKDNKVLLSPQWDGYDFPGGAIEIYETIEEALIREVKEETGLEVEVGKLVACESCFFKLPYSGKCVNSILIYRLCKVVGGEISVEGFDGNEKEFLKKAEWISLDRIDSLKFYNSVDSKKILKTVFS